MDTKRIISFGIIRVFCCLSLRNLPSFAVSYFNNEIPEKTRKSIIFRDNSRLSLLYLKNLFAVIKSDNTTWHHFSCIEVDKKT